MFQEVRKESSLAIFEGAVAICVELLKSLLDALLQVLLSLGFVVSGSVRRTTLGRARHGGPGLGVGLPVIADSLNRSHSRMTHVTM